MHVFCLPNYCLRNALGLRSVCHRYVPSGNAGNDKSILCFGFFGPIRSDGLAFGQVIFGPLSDKYGRKPVLYFSLLLYIVSTLFCCLSQNIDTFNIARLLQGLGGAGAIVYSRSAPTDLYSGKELAKIIAIVGAVNGIAPVAAPVIGGSVANLIGWRGIFYILLGIGVVITAMVIPVKETLPKDAREQGLFPSFV